MEKPVRPPVRTHLHAHPLDRSSADYDILVQCIVDTARRLERAGVKEDRFGIQFVQIGTDPSAAQALRALDDDLESTYNVRVCYILTLAYGGSDAIPRILWNLPHSTLIKVYLTLNTCSGFSSEVFARLSATPLVINTNIRYYRRRWDRCKMFYLGKHLSSRLRASGPATISKITSENLL